MKASKKPLVIVLAVALSGAVLWVYGCQEPEVTSGKAGKAFAANVKLCLKCGQIKGTDVCCKADAQKCSKCGLAKGAPGCCKLPKTK